MDAKDRDRHYRLLGATLAFAIVGLLLAAGTALGHGGGLDSHGCHHNRKAGGYHCHRGPLAGQHFGSQADMLQKLRGAGSAPKSANPATAAGEPSREEDAVQRLRRLNDLRDKGLVTEEEYKVKRAEILRDL